MTALPLPLATAAAAAAPDVRASCADSCVCVRQDGTQLEARACVWQQQQQATVSHHLAVCVQVLPAAVPVTSRTPVPARSAR